MLRPKLFDTLKDYSRRQFAKDLIAGTVVAIVALPLAIAFAIASGVTPEKGLYTAIIAGFIISMFGGSRVQIGGPTGAFVIIVYGIVHKFGYNGLVIATLMAGIILVVFGLCKLGAVIKFIPYSVTVGFTLGIALLIFTGQISDFLGLGLQNLPADFADKMAIVGEHLSSVSLEAVCIGMATAAIIFLTGRVNRRIPGSLVAIVVSSAAVYFLKLPVETIGSRFGEIPHTFAAPSFPHLDFKTVRSLINPAFTIAMLGAIESLLSAVVADGMIGGKHRSNMELVAQGAANIVSPIFGGIPATGAIARTATNVKSGGRTPVAGIIHALMLMALMLFFGKFVGFIPMACLAGILMVVAYHMSEWRSALSIVLTSRSSALVLIATFCLTVLVDLTVAIEVGLILATLVFIRNMSIHTNVSMVMPRQEDEAEPDYAATQKSMNALPKGAVMYEINGPLFFGAVYKFREALATISKPPKVLIVEMQLVPVVDSTGVQLLKESFAALRKKGTVFVLSGLQPQVRGTLERSGLIGMMSPKDVCATTDEALARAKEICG